ncbi:hypothetical protein EDC21_1443 [Thermohydrogenium kirishiense]|nr:hypothetical protein EDC21_1443 [Thermohydrogenium kirishiense]
MNKNKKIIIAVCAFGIIGIIIGFLGREDILQKFLSTVLILIIFATIWDVYIVFKAKRDFGEIRWNVKTTNNTLILAMSIYIILIAAISNTNFKDTLHTKLLATIFIAGIIPLVHC